MVRRVWHGGLCSAQGSRAVSNARPRAHSNARVNVAARRLALGGQPAPDLHPFVEKDLAVIRHTLLFADRAVGAHERVVAKIDKRPVAIKSNSEDVAHEIRVTTTSGTVQFGR